MSVFVLKLEMGAFGIEIDVLASTGKIFHTDENFEYIPV